MSDLLKPERIQRKRTKGWKMPGGAVYVGRPTKWGNPYTTKECGSREFAVTCFRIARSTMPQEREAIREALRGKNLACWCQLDQPCHADVLLEIANSEPSAPTEASIANQV